MNLALFAHPDDETLACGGLIARDPTNWYVAVMADGTSSRDTQHHGNRFYSEKRQAHFKAAMATLGVPEGQYESHGLPDQRLDTLDFLDFAKGVAQIIDRVQPDAVFTHFRGDLNRDHRITCEAVHVACRPPNAPALYECEVASSTEWGTGERFAPNVYLRATLEAMEKKTAALLCYTDEVRPYPHPRSARAIYARAQYWGQVSGCEYAEPFTLVREVR